MLIKFDAILTNGTIHFYVEPEGTVYFEHFRLTFEFPEGESLV